MFDEISPAVIIYLGFKEVPRIPNEQKATISASLFFPGVS
jgi:hypothetical protein